MTGQCSPMWCRWRVVVSWNAWKKCVLRTLHLLCRFNPFHWRIQWSLGWNDLRVGMFFCDKKSVVKMDRYEGLAYHNWLTLGSCRSCWLILNETACFASLYVGCHQGWCQSPSMWQWQSTFFCAKWNLFQFLFFFSIDQSWGIEIWDVKKAAVLFRQWRANGLFPTFMAPNDVRLGRWAMSLRVPFFNTCGPQILNVPGSSWPTQIISIGFMVMIFDEKKTSFYQTSATKKPHWLDLIFVCVLYIYIYIYIYTYIPRKSKPNTQLFLLVGSGILNPWIKTIHFVWSWTSRVRGKKHR